MKKYNIIRFIRLCLLAILSTAWLLPIGIGVQILLSWLYDAHQKQYIDEGDCGLRIQLVTFFIEMGIILLAAAILIWSIIIASKLWPSKKNE